MSALSQVLRHPTLRLIAVALLLIGAHNASLYPYQSVIAIERIGLSKPEYSWLLTLASAVAVTSSVVFGVLGDQLGHRRRIALISALCSTLGVALMLAFPGKLALVLFHGILLPLASSLYGQLFALARITYAEEGRRRDAVLGALRSNLSFSFLAMLIFWTLAFRFGLSEMRVYVTGGIASLGMSLLVYFGWPKDRGASAEAMRLSEALAAIVRPSVALRVALIGMIASAGNLYMVLTSLVFDASTVRGPADVALYIGLVAGWEVPSMLIVPRFAHRLSRSALAGWGAAIYGLHLALLPLWVDTPFLWLGTVFAGAGGAIIITTPIPYYQDLMRGRPGTAAAMLAVQKLVADLTTALIFAFGTKLGGFQTAALIGVGVSLSGAAGLWLVDRKSWLIRPAHG